jgi:peptidoglycan/LPS O-acetylase OafA/YrhL
MQTISANNSRPQRKILGFNGVRGVCVILVFLYHKCGIPFHTAEIGVWTFLALSGFLLIPELHKQRVLVETGTSSEIGEAGRFWFKRATRIFPLYFSVILFLYLFSGYFAWAGSDLGFRYHVFFLSNFFFAQIAPADTLAGPFGVLWTLSVEQQFYLVAPMIFLLLPSRHHIVFCGTTAFFCGIWHVWLSISGFTALTVYMLSPWNFAIILLGGAAGLVCRKPGFANNFAPLWLPGSLLAIAGFAASYMIEGANEGFAYAILTMAVTVAIALLLAGLYTNQTNSLITGLEWPPLERLGQFSYGFYLFHNFIPNPLGKIFYMVFGTLPSNALKVTLGAIIGFAITTAISYLSWEYFEKPIIQLRERALRSRASASRPLTQHAQSKPSVLRRIINGLTHG